MGRDSPLHVMALISAVDIAAISSISLSASVSSSCGSAVGLRDKASGALFEVPFSQLAVNACPMILVFRHCSHRFRISVVVQYWDERVVVCYDREVRQASQEDVTFGDSPCDC